MLRLSVGGDPEGGWLVDIHDGTKHGVYRPEGVENDVDALIAALKDHDPELLDAVRGPDHADDLAKARGEIADLKMTLGVATKRAADFEETRAMEVQMQAQMQAAAQKAQADMKAAHDKA